MRQGEGGLAIAASEPRGVDGLVPRESEGVRRGVQSLTQILCSAHAVNRSRSVGRERGHGAGAFVVLGRVGREVGAAPAVDQRHEVAAIAAHKVGHPIPAASSTPPVTPTPAVRRSGRAEVGAPAIAAELVQLGGVEPSDLGPARVVAGDGQGDNRQHGRELVPGADMREENGITRRRHRAEVPMTRSRIRAMDALHGDHINDPETGGAVSP